MFTFLEIICPLHMEFDSFALKCELRLSDSLAIGLSKEDVSI